MKAHTLPFGRIKTFLFLVILASMEIYLVRETRTNIFSDPAEPFCYHRICPDRFVCRTQTCCESASEKWTFNTSEKSCLT